MAKLLMLKEYLELDDDGFVLGVGVTTIRSLLDAELLRESAMRNAARSAAAANGNALGKFAAAIEAVKARCLPSSSRQERATFSVLSRKNKTKEKDKKTKQRLTADQNPSAAVGWQCLRFPSPVISSGQSNCSHAASPAPYYLQVSSSTSEERKEHSPPPSSSSQPSGNEEVTSITATLSAATEFDGRELEENESNDDAEKIRVNLVSVIDYTNKKDCVVVEEEEEEEEEEESFYRSLDNIERSTEQLLHQIRRFEMLAELDPPMECCSLSSDGDDDVSSPSSHAEEEEGRAWEMFGRLKANAPQGGGEKLLLDFFIQGGKTDGGLLLMRQRETTTTTELLRTARRWIDGSPGGEVEEDCGHGEAATLREMEINGRWRCFHEEVDELALRFGDAMLQLLVEKLVKELASQL
ncbi:uncharacterized protein LOC122018700 [Zingiber officinale]|uniref:DUF4378 domain-containing protein n=1 Tax=Zingiber officinale TaxID=94328 RepID=A0A8J5F127_ZINOF|nr:uncharacterized protein LOC122018700 [Zingiber officinale]KAG6479420.1 hypothetical protein ZIOFF_062885 [Zingiber officinale]